MIAGQLFKRVEVGRNYKIHIVMNMTYRQFCEQWQETPRTFRHSTGKEQKS